MSFKVEFNLEEKIILSKYNIVFLNNERKYIYYDYSKFIYEYGVPTFFSCDDFLWNGNDWKSLLEEFANWFIVKTNYNKDVFLKMKLSSNNKSIFTIIKESNCYGPLVNATYIRGNPTSAMQVWRKILDLVSFLSDDIKKNIKVYIHYPSAVEPEKVFTLIWKKEIKMFRNYLSELGYKSEAIEKQINIIKILNSVYKKISPNYYFFIIDRKQDLSNALSRIKKSHNLLNHYQLNYNQIFPIIENIVDFKKELYYENVSFLKNKI